jgi:hypothetical protein
MGNIETCGEFSLLKGEEGMINIVKSRNKKFCRCCESSIPAGSFCLGRGWNKVCLKCADKFYNNLLNSFKEYVKHTEDLLNEFKLKEARMQKSNILAKVNDG